MPRPIKWGGKIKGNLSELRRFSGLELWRYSPSAQVETNSSGIEDSKMSYLKESEMLEMARAGLPPELSYLKFLPS
jgi:hypothetical protein